MKSKLIRRSLTSSERKRFEKYAAEIFDRLGMDRKSDSCMRTPKRWLQALVDMTEGYNRDPNANVVFDRECENCNEEDPTVQIVEGPIPFTSLCEHHVLPIIGNAYVGYLRNQKILGLSKFTRIVRQYAHRFTLQERIAQDVANELEEVAQPYGVIIFLQAHHCCTQCRGVREIGASTRTIEQRGAYLTNPNLVIQFMSMIRQNKAGIS